MTKGSYKVNFVLESFEDAFTCPGVCLPEITVDGIEGVNYLCTLLFRCFMLPQNSVSLNS